MKGLRHYLLNNTVAVEWNPELAQRFPNVDHSNCRQRYRIDGDRWVPVTPVACVDWHCPVCGQSCNCLGHHRCGGDAT